MCSERARRDIAQLTGHRIHCGLGKLGSIYLFLMIYRKFINPSLEVFRHLLQTAVM